MPVRHLTLGLWLISAAAQGAAPEPGEPTFHKTVEANGYFSSRTTYARSRVGGLISTDDLPQWNELLEFNVQVKVKMLEHSFAVSDVSLIGQLAGDFRSAGPEGTESILSTKDVASARPLVSINELYVLHEFAPWFNVMLGKKRLVWGPGQVWNPTDLINVRRDPTDPTFQRAGGWLVRAEVPLERVTFTAVFAPAVLLSTNGIPSAFVAYPEWKQVDTQAHYLAELRAYALVADTDINAMIMFSNRYADDFENKLRGGLSFSRYFFKDYELHAEALLQTGSNRAYVNAACVTSAIDALACGMARMTFAEKLRLVDPTFLPQLLIGTRRQFNDESLISIEYLYLADGMTRGQFQDLINGYDLLKQALAAGVTPSAIRGASLITNPPAPDGMPARFNFSPTMQHYLFVSYQRPRIHDDFTAQVTLIANLQDLSTLWTPSVSWSTTEWLTLSLHGFIPLSGPAGLAVTQPSNGQPLSEFGLFPNWARVVFEARLFF